LLELVGLGNLGFSLGVELLSEQPLPVSLTLSCLLLLFVVNNSIEVLNGSPFIYFIDAGDNTHTLLNRWSDDTILISDSLHHCWLLCWLIALGQADLGDEGSLTLKVTQVVTKT